MREVLNADPEIASHNFAGGDQAVIHRLRHADRHGKPDALISTGLGKDGGIDADQFAVGIDQGAARVSGVDGGIGLDKVFILRNPHLAATQGAHNTKRHGGIQAKGIPDRQHIFPDLQLRGVTPAHERQILGIDLHDRQVRLRVGTENFPLELTLVRQRHRQLSASADDVIVRDDIAVR